ncbi:Ap4A phosphorylase-like protein II [Patellaria atrata CBS 101060]|uniref:Ap4A phosphorylase-like protein II n=1 Tax=Patellaria atrata CBS 101060 TaxID=1346257 RepID=A0A9P4VLV8_9PEZI|nr:Ap4A phosphorylase-like protein II [Patellaria atrata CBS 101060]
MLDLSIPLSTLVATRFRGAKATPSLIFSKTQLTVIRTSSGVPFQLLYCPALAKKEKKDELDKNKPKSPMPYRDPFDMPQGHLFIAEVPQTDPSHVLVLNKYPVIQEHFIITTKINKPQTHLLEPIDLGLTYNCLEAWEEHSIPLHRKRLFAFFNSGPLSGASQPHRHLQFLPVESMTRGADSKGWHVLAESLGDSLAEKVASGEAVPQCSPRLPFRTYALHVPENPTQDQLYTIYMKLFRMAESAVRDFITTNPGKLELHDTSTGNSPISYNLAMTRNVMIICPRQNGGKHFQTKEGEVLGYIELNGTILAGTVMVKLEKEWELMKNDQSQLDMLLSHVGLPQKWSHE